MESKIGALKIYMGQLENPTKTYLSRGIIKKVGEIYYIYVSNKQIAAKYDENNHVGQELIENMRLALGIDVKVRYIDEMVDDVVPNSEEMELIQAYRTLDAGQKQLVKQMLKIE